MSRLPTSSITLCQPPASYSGGRAFPKSYLKSRKPDPDGADLLIMDVDAFRPDFDVIDELTNNRDAYKGEEKLTMYGWPASHRTCIDLIRSQVAQNKESNKPTIQLALACCVAGSMSQWTKYEDLHELSALREELNLSTTVPMYEREELSGWFRSFAVSIIDGVGSGVKIEQDVVLPKQTNASVSEIAEELGVSRSVVLALSIAITLADQVCIPPEYKAQFEQTVNVFTTRVKLRVGVAKLLLGKTQHSQHKMNTGPANRECLNCGWDRVYGDPAAAAGCDDRTCHRFE